MKILLILLACFGQEKDDDGDPYCLLYADMKRDYFHAPARSDMYVEIPGEDWEEGDEERCGKLNMSLNGTREAALNWQEACIEFMEKNGFATGRASTCA